MESVLDSTTLTPPNGAGVPSITAKVWLCPGASDTLLGRIKAPGGKTFTVATLSAMVGKLLA